MRAVALILGLVGGLAGGLAACAAAAQVPVATTGAEMETAGTTAGLQDWIAGFRGRALTAGISAAVFDGAMAGLAYLPDVVRRDRNQNEFTKTIWDYLDTATSEDRVAGGITALAQNRDLLDRIEAAYGVEAEVVVAIWGLESAYGAVRGDVRTLQALATLAYDGRRGAFFEAQLLAALQILQAGDTSPDRMLGSWAGAMGHTQFMPTSYHSFAVDFTGDGRRDIWGDDPADALASTAAYLATNGWTSGQPWGLEVRLPAGFDYGQTGERVKRTVAEWQAMGVAPWAGGALPDHGMASVLLPGGARGAAFVIFANFQVIETYNTADAYVIAVGHLADRIAGGPPIHATWPRDYRALTLPERIEMQTRLGAVGFDPGGVDGKIGPLTIAAVRAFQRSAGLVPDGYPSLDILTRLR